MAAAAHPPLTTLMTRLSPIIIEGRPMPHEPEPAWAIAASSAAAAAAVAAAAAAAAAAADEGEALPNKSSRASGLLPPPTAAALDAAAAGRARVPLRLVPMLGEHVPGDDDWPPPPPPSDAPPGRRRLWPARVGAPGDGIGWALLCVRSKWNYYVSVFFIWTKKTVKLAFRSWVLPVTDFSSIRRPSVSLLSLLLLKKQLNDEADCIALLPCSGTAEQHQSLSLES